MKEVERAATNSIGKTTFKNNGTEKFSRDVSQLRQEKRKMKKQFLLEANTETKKVLLQKYKEKQTELKEKIQQEQKQKLELRFEKMIESKNSDMFWKERKRMNRDVSLELLITKDENGKRLYDAEKNKENIARYYENLFSKQNKPHHPYHEQLKQRIGEILSDREHEKEPYNNVPKDENILKVIRNKKNRKATTDLKNELLKGGGFEMMENRENTRTME